MRRALSLPTRSLMQAAPLVYRKMVSFRFSRRSGLRMFYVIHAGGMGRCSAHVAFGLLAVINRGLLFAGDDQELFLGMLADLRGQLDADARLPNWPFRAPKGFVTIFEYDGFLGDR